MSTQLTRCYAQGARCGHLEARTSLYSEEMLIVVSQEAARVNTNSPATQDAWASGYRFGYRTRRTGQPLPTHIINEELPE